MRPARKARVGVGMPITEHPLHRSGRAGLPHPALALGSETPSADWGTDDKYAGGEASARDSARGVPTTQTPSGSAAAKRGATAGAGPCETPSGSARCAARRSSGRARAAPSAGRLLAPGWARAGAAAVRVLTSCSFACHLRRIVWRSTVNRPVLVFPQQCVKPRKLKVSGFPSPRPRRFRSARRPNSMRRVLSGCSVRPNRAKRSRSSVRKRSASARCSNPTTKSSAKRTTTTAPRACVRRHRWTQRSKT